jgi:Dolichyl-phosphate-mannose-protein mannosyltransferase
MNPAATAWPRRLSGKSAEAPAISRRLTAAGVAAPAVAIGVIAVALRIAFAPQLDILDDAGYLEAARRVSRGQSLEQLFPLFRLRTGMAYPLGWLMSANLLEPMRFWFLTIGADLIAMAALAAAARLFTGTARAALCTAGLYAIYPLAIQQSAMYYPTSFQVASIAVACALVALAERATDRRRWLSAFGAGLSLGVGYLFKEDVAIVVPAMVLASLIASTPRLTTMIAMCAGAAAIFGAECTGFWITTGHPLYRLTATSGLGAPIAGDLQIAEIWKWNAYVRSLWLLPVQVGILWWLAIPATWMAWRSRRSQPGIAFVALLFVIVMAYLQFGSGSLASYSPLPKTPRYTALATPFLMLVVGAWLADAFERRRRAARAIAALVLIAAVPCVWYLQLSASERTRNTIAAARALATLGPGSLYTDYYTARVLRLVAPDRDIRVWYHAKFDENRMTVLAPPQPGAYALLDRQAAKVYSSSYRLRLPPEVITIPPDATVVWTHHAYPPATMSRRLLESVQGVAARLPEGNAMRSRIDRMVIDMIEGDDAVLYRLPSP